MEKRPIIYATLKPVRDDGQEAEGLHNIAFVPDPAVEVVGVYLNEHDKRIVADEDVQSKIIEHLSNCGIERPKHWKEVTDEQYFEAKGVKLTTDPTAQESFNDFQDPKGGGQWLVRYSYDGPEDEKNRTFCAQIIGLNRIYTEEEIKNGLSNPEFGNYSIFDYKGSYGCRHRWKRNIFYEDYEDDEVRKVGNVPQVVSKLDDSDATTKNVFLSTDEKKQVVAPLLIPDKKIYRNDKMGEYDLVFTKETIEEIKNRADKAGAFKKVDLFKDTHEGGNVDSEIIDVWLIEDSKDKAYTDYGFTESTLPIGTLMVHSQIKNNEYWEKEIKGNKKFAYSIEALVNMTLTKMSQNKIEQMEKTKLEDYSKEELMARLEAMEKEEEPKPVEAVEEEKPVEAEEKPVEAEEEEAPATDDGWKEKLESLEEKFDSLIEQIAEMKNAMDKPIEEAPVEMSDNRPLWKKIADGTKMLNK